MNEAADHLASFYQSKGSVGRDFRNDNLITWVVSRVRGRRVIDIGSGNGAFCAALHVRGGHEVAGFEPNVELVRQAQVAFPHISFVVASAEDVDRLVVEPVDAIVMMDVLEHLADDRRVLRAIHRSLARGGDLILAVPAHPGLFGQRDKHYGHFRRYAKNELKEKLIHAGFTVQELRYWNMLGVIPYWVSEKVLARPLEVSLRAGSGAKRFGGRMTHRLLDFWFRTVENRMSAGFGLTLLAVARKPR